VDQTVERLLREEFDYERGSLDFSCPRLELTIGKGETVEGSFMVYGFPEKITKGYITTSDIRMECLTPEFCGNEEEIEYCFHSDGLEEGDVVKGEFYVISNQGEYYLPYVVTVAYYVLESSLGGIKNLFHFANLAKTDMREAVNLFYSPGFKQILTGNDRQFLKVYEGLSKYKGNAQNLEEFLIAINKKQKTEYLTETKDISIENPEGIREEILSITKNGWGYTFLNVETEGTFLSVEKTSLTEDDFLGNYCRLPYYINAEGLHAGRNFGSICLYNAYTSLHINVTVIKSEGFRVRKRKEYEKKQVICQMMKYYQALRLKKIGTAAWLDETWKLVEKLLTFHDKEPASRLFQAQLLITKERYNEAKWILDRLGPYMERPDAGPVLYCYYLYLNTLYNREESYVNQIAEEVEAVYRENEGNWRIAWLLLYLSEDYSRSAQKKWCFLEEQFAHGCRSPVIYAEAAQLVISNPALLMKIEGFEFQILNYMAKNGVMTPEVALQVQYLIQKTREYSKNLLFLLEVCYQVRPEDEILLAICTMLIKGGCIGGACFKWYEEAVKRQLRVIRLYEYYMMSVDLQSEKPLPKTVAMYFSYHSDLDYERNAFLYANVHKNRESFPEVYKAYEKNIEKFVIEQILKEHINRNLAYLYKNLLTPQMINEETANALSKLLFINQIEFKRADIRQVVVCHAGAAVEKVYPVCGGKAQVPIFGSDYTLLFEDGSKNRYQKSVAYTMEKFMLSGKFAKMIAPFVSGQTGYAAYMCECSNQYVNITEENVFFFLQLLESEEIEKGYKKEISLKLVQFYYDGDRIRELDEYLEALEPDWFEPKERGKIIQFLVSRGFYEKAYEWIRLYGMETVDAKVLVRLCDRLLEREEYVGEALMCAAVMRAFRHGKYNEALLEYLMKEFNGMTKELRDIWKAAEVFELDTFGFSERILLQILYTGSYIGEKQEIFKSYVQKSGKTELELAFLAQGAYDYFVKEKIPESYLFGEIIRLYGLSEDIPFICKLAAVKYYAENKNEIGRGEHFHEMQMRALGDFITEMTEKGIVLSCFKEYADMFPAARQCSDKLVIEYRTHPDAKVILHYMIEKEEDEGAEYHTEEMKKIFGGVCAKEFVLFFGENLQYYIIEERGGRQQLTESNSLQKSDIMEESIQTKFSLINDMVISETLQDYDTVDALIEEYLWQEYENSQLFFLQQD